MEMARKCVSSKWYKIKTIERSSFLMGNLRLKLRIFAVFDFLRTEALPKRASDNDARLVCSDSRNLLFTKKKSSEACKVHFIWTEFFLSEYNSLRRRRTLEYASFVKKSQATKIHQFSLVNYFLKGVMLFIFLS